MFSGFDLNTPAYSSEIQCPALGVDLKIFDTEGKEEKYLRNNNKHGRQTSINEIKLLLN